MKSNETHHENGTAPGAFGLILEVGALAVRTRGRKDASRAAAGPGSVTSPITT